ncbi:hypothetical protein RMSM_04393 [Rhodopirellula maiorica SM1]|uniref:GxxExxY protein n=1 Tax=Rhodopirellula maiorica SM1 TaxID=1265738 RepID=M5RTH2_9BACT|nr:GxxExxY protein [Rhodopirellula maiorica]EMI18682.1 hypothetical protein RMSM_04393 [Rhodopirellula maiorica SM1]
MRKVDYRVMGIVFSIHNELGRLCDESVYQVLFENRVYRTAGLEVHRELPIDVSFGSFCKTYRMDCVVAESVIYELKCVRALSKIHEAQLLNYLLLVNATRGKIVNFRTEKVESRFVNTSLDRESRRQYDLTLDDEIGQHRITDLLKELLDDWGTGLSGQLYLEAILSELGCADSAPQQLPMLCDGRAAGNQAFYLLDSQTALFLTTLKPEYLVTHEKHLAAMLRLSPLKSAVWINIDLHRVDCQAVTGRKMLAGR